MSVYQKVIFGVTVSWGSKLINILSGLLVIPVLFRLIDKEQLGIWFLLGNSQQFISILDFGITPTLTRHIAFAFSNSEDSDESNMENLIATGQVILRYLAVVSFFIASIIGYIFIYKLDLQSINVKWVLLSWTLLCGSYAVGICFSYLSSWLVGVGYVGWEGFFGTCIYIAALLGNVFIAFLGFGLVGLAIIAFSNALLKRLIMLWFINKVQPQLFKIKGKWDRNIAIKLFKPSMLAWLTGLGGLIIHKTDTLFIAFFEGVQDLPDYQAAYILTGTIYSLAISFPNSTISFVSQAWKSNDIQMVHELTIRGAQIGMLIIGSGTAFLMTVGEELFNLWLGKDNFIGYGVLIVFCVMFTLEAQQMNLVSSARATEDEKYVITSLTAALLNVIFTWLLIKPFGLLGVAMGTMFAQILTNNWYAVYRPLKRLNINFRLYMNKVLLIWFQVLTLSVGFSVLAKHILNNYGVSPLVHIIISGIICGGFFMLFIWNKVITHNQQQYFVIKIKTKLIKFFNIKT